MFIGKWKIYFTIYRRKCKKFDEAWVKTYVLIWDSYCSRNDQHAIKEMPDFDRIIRNDSLLLLDNIETLMNTTEKSKYPTLILIEVF